MCEFKIINKTDSSQIGEDVLVLSYTENNELVFKDVLGIGEKLESALILDVNTLNQTCIVLQHPLIREFLELILSIDAKNDYKVKIEEFIKSLEDLKKNL
ncbi:MAG: CooT family nickel-binding protein [Promethearchaeota archaeon]|nr:MAG: CooT family nickel-binding protein [Candidatus Lokiarchaeota archaeon]